jgi:hypothetical protein
MSNPSGDSHAISTSKTPAIDQAHIVKYIWIGVYGSLFLFWLLSLTWDKNDSLAEPETISGSQVFISDLNFTDGESKVLFDHPVTFKIDIKDATYDVTDGEAMINGVHVKNGKIISGDASKISEKKIHVVEPMSKEVEMTFMSQGRDTYTYSSDDHWNWEFQLWYLVISLLVFGLYAGILYLIDYISGLDIIDAGRIGLVWISVGFIVFNYGIIWVKILFKDNILSIISYLLVMTAWIYELTLWLIETNINKIGRIISNTTNKVIRTTNAGRGLRVPRNSRTELHEHEAHSIEEEEVLTDQQFLEVIEIKDLQTNDGVFFDAKFEMYFKIEKHNENSPNKDRAALVSNYVGGARMLIKNAVKRIEEGAKAHDGEFSSIELFENAVKMKEFKMKVHEFVKEAIGKTGEKEPIETVDDPPAMFLDPSEPYKAAKRLAFEKQQKSESDKLVSEIDRAGIDAWFKAIQAQDSTYTYAQAIVDYNVSIGKETKQTMNVQGSGSRNTTVLANVK